MLIFISVFTPAFLCTLFFVPKVKKLGSKLSLLDYPSKRKIHNEPLVRIGGVALGIGFFIGFLVSATLSISGM